MMYTPKNNIPASAFLRNYITNRLPKNIINDSDIVYNVFFRYPGNLVFFMANIGVDRFSPLIRIWINFYIGIYNCKSELDRNLKAYEFYKFSKNIKNIKI